MARQHKLTSDENVSDAKLPGHSLLEAIFHRRLMSWSDRGGASRLIGDQWAIRCEAYLKQSIGDSWPIPDGGEFTLNGVIRLDENPGVEREANRYQLENPDFLLAGVRDGGAVVQAADAKFAADRIKSSQVSVDALRNLLDIPEDGATRELLKAELRRLSLASPDVVTGVFLSPDSALTDMLLNRARRRGDTDIDLDQIVRIPAEPGQIFSGLPMSPLVGTLARLDRLPVTPRNNLLSAIYYFRSACACFYFWTEERRPLLGNDRDTPDPEPGLIAASTAARAERASSAFHLLEKWFDDLSWVMMARDSVRDVARLPVAMAEIRKRVAGAEIADERGAVRMIRRDLEIAFRNRLLEETGTIYPDDSRPLDRILKDVGAVARSLRPEMMALLDSLISQHQVMETSSTG